MSKIAILLSTYNGENFIEEQLDSLYRQVGVNFDIYVRDDGSTDNTIAILKKYSDNQKLNLIKGNNLGPALSFMTLLNSVDNYDYYAFCDQDDVWDSNKLEVAINKLEQNNKNLPALYFSNLRIVDEKLNYQYTTNRNPKLDLGAALIVNYATGCTMVINNKLKELASLSKQKKFIMHDAWLYKLCFAVDGCVVFDNEPHISYRQHNYNNLGEKDTFLSRFYRRLRYLFENKTRLREFDAYNLIKFYNNLIPKHNNSMIMDVVNYRKSVKNKLRLLKNSKMRVNTMNQNLTFFIAVIMGVF